MIGSPYGSSTLHGVEVVATFCRQKVDFDASVDWTYD